MESKWFVDENVKNIDKEILLCFPYAGASINMFSMWKEYIDKVIVCPVKLPFRDARRKEKLPESVQKLAETSVYKGYKQDKIEMRGDRAEMSDFPLYLNTVAGGLDRRDQTIGGFSFVVKIYAVPVVEIIG